MGLVQRRSTKAMPESFVHKKGVACTCTRGACKPRRNAASQTASPFNGKDIMCWNEGLALICDIGVVRFSMFPSAVAAVLFLDQGLTEILVSVSFLCFLGHPCSGLAPWTRISYSCVFLAQVTNWPGSDNRATVCCCLSSRTKGKRIWDSGLPWIAFRPSVPTTLFVCTFALWPN